MGTRLANLASKHVERLAAKGNIEDAYEVVLNIRAANQADLTICRRVSSTIEARLLASYRDRFADLAALPRQTVIKADLRKQNLQSFDVYLWGFFDGATSLQDVLDVSSASELDTLRSIGKLVDQGLLAITPTRSAADASNAA